MGVQRCMACRGKDRRISFDGKRPLPNRVGSEDGLVHFDELQYIKFMDFETVIQSLANPHRRLMLKWLKHPRQHFPPALPEHADLPGACASYIYEKSDLSQGTVSQYLSQLERAGLIIRSRHGKWTFFHRDEAAIRQAFAALGTELEVE